MSSLTPSKYHLVKYDVNIFFDKPRTPSLLRHDGTVTSAWPSWDWLDRYAGCNENSVLVVGSHEFRVVSHECLLTRRP